MRNKHKIKKSFSSPGRRIELGITGNWTGLDVSPAPLISQLSKDIKIRCFNYNNISDRFNGKTWLTELWYSEGVAVFDNKGKLVISIRMVIGWVVLLMCKKNFKMNKRELNLSISTPSVNNFM